jgi:hypothetical protein
MFHKSLIALTAAAVVVAGCGGSSKKSTSATNAGATAGTTSTTPKGPAYNPKIDPSQFTTNITQAYWPIKPGARWHYTGKKDGVPEDVVVSVLKGTKTVMGVKTVIVSDIVTQNHTLTEKTTDWYAQDKKGNLWYFGEDTKEYVNGVVSSTHGTWEAGVDNAKPGIVIQASPKVGVSYRQEYRPGQAEDMAQVLSFNGTVNTPAGVFNNVMTTKDTDPLNPDKIEHKQYAKGIGPVHVIRVGGTHREETKLVKKTG